MYCPECYYELSKNFRYCPNCGKYILDYIRNGKIKNVIQKVVCVDFDGVLLDFCKALSDALLEHGYNLDPQGVIDYNFKYDIGFPRKIVFETMKQARMYLLEEPYEGAIEALDLLKKYTIVKPYTGCVDKPEAITIRQELINSFGLKGKPYVDCDKPVYFQADALFEDNLLVIKDWQMANSKAKIFLINQPYNQQTSDNSKSLDWSCIVRCKNFADAVNKYLSM